MNQLFTQKNNILTKINLILILILPIGLIIGSLICNVIVILIGLLFLLEILIKSEKSFLNEKNFYFLIIINLYLILNSFLISENSESILKSFGFFRFILLAYALSYYFQKFEKKIINFWFLIFIFVTFDLLYEFIIGHNILGYEANYPGRLAGFSGDELKIGGYYFGFIFLSLSIFFKKKYLIFLFSLTFLIVALLIGERSNFIKILIIFSLFFTFYYKISYLRKSLIILIFLIIPLLIINNLPTFKNKFVYQIFSKNLISFIKQKNTNLNDVIHANQHFSHYYVAFRIFKDNPVFGAGFKSFRIESYKIKYKKEIYGGSTHPHQLHFELLSEIGLVGYLLIFTNLFYLIYCQFQIREKNALSICGTLFIIATMIPFLPSGSFFTSYNATIFFINYSFLIRPR